MANISSIDRLWTNDPTLTDLDLSRQVTAENADGLAKALKNNNTLLKLNLSANKFFKPIGTKIIEALHGHQLEILELNESTIDYEFIDALAKMIETTQTITKLELKKAKNLNLKGVTRLANALASNYGMHTLDLSGTRLGKGAKGSIPQKIQKQIKEKLAMNSQYAEKLGMNKKAKEAQREASEAARAEVANSTFVSPDSSAGSSRPSSLKLSQAVVNSVLVPEMVPLPESTHHQTLRIMSPLQCGHNPVGLPYELIDELLIKALLSLRDSLSLSTVPLLEKLEAVSKLTSLCPPPLLSAHHFQRMLTALEEGFKAFCEGRRMLYRTSTLSHQERGNRCSQLMTKYYMGSSQSPL